MNENIRTSYGTGKPLANNNSELGRFIVLANNVVSPVISSSTRRQQVPVQQNYTTIKENQVDKKIRVMFFAGPSNTLTDYAPEILLLILSYHKIISMGSIKKHGRMKV